MKSINKMSLIALSLLSITACTTTPPDCNDPKVISKLTDVQVGLYSEILTSERDTIVAAIDAGLNNEFKQDGIIIVNQPEIKYNDNGEPNWIKTESNSSNTIRIAKKTENKYETITECTAIQNGVVRLNTKYTITELLFPIIKFNESQAIRLSMAIGDNVKEMSSELLQPVINHIDKTTYVETHIDVDKDIKYTAEYDKNKNIIVTIKQ